MGLNTNIAITRLISSLSFKCFALLTNIPVSKIMQSYQSKLVDCANHLEAINICSLTIATTETVKILPISQTPKYFINSDTYKNIGIEILLFNKYQYITQSLSRSLAHRTPPKYKLVVANPINLNNFHIRDDSGQLTLLEKFYCSKIFRLKVHALQSFKFFNNYLIRRVIIS